MNLMKYIYFHRPAPTLSVFMIATLCIALLMTPNATTAETTLRVTDGFLQENTVYTDKTILDLTGLDRTRKVSSTATVKNGQVKHLVYITGGEDALPDTLATSLYMSFSKTRIACTAKDVKCYILIEYLPPHTYLVFKETTSYKTDGARSFGIRAGWEANTTVVLLDSVLEDGTGEGLATAIVTMDVSNKRIFTDNCVIHIKKMQVTGFLGFISFPATLEQQSALVVEDVDAISLWYPVFLLSSLTLKDHSAVIVARAKNTHETNSKVKAILQTHSITVDETSVFSLIDVDVSNDYKGTSAGLIIGNNVLSGDGLFVFARLLMQKSGLATMAPVNNANFWVSARKGKSGVDMTVAELQAENFNVNSDHVFNWDGTGADGTTCVPVGGSIPGRATYKLIGGKCTATCKEGFIAPACNAPENKCRVDNCDLCYRVTKTKCMLCAPHTKTENSEQICRCPANLENCQVCPSASACTMCVEGYNLTKGGAPCIPCSKSVPNCAHCDEPNVCERCAPHYNVSTNKKECYACPDKNCISCSGNEVCAECVPHYNLSAIGQPKNRCISCKVPNCQLCKEDDKCDTCIPGYTKPQGQTTCVHCPIEHCERCDVDGVCAQCPDTHTPVDGKHCHPCTMPGCLTCDGDEQCTDCDDKHTLVNQKCVSCDIPNCKSCLIDGVCDECQGTYHLLVEEGGATQCVHCDIPNCDACHVDGICHACAPFYSLSAINEPQNNCISCNVPNCQHCKEDDKCDTCAADYTKPEGKTTCAHCPIEHCERCDVDGVCAQCPEKHTPVEGKHCHPCTMPGCLACDGNEKCADCDDTYTKVGHKCVSCDIPNCKSCLVDDICDVCEPRHTLIVSGTGTWQCIPCNIDGCAACDENSHCSVCTNGNPPLHNGKECVSCEVEHCIFCGSADTCHECAASYNVSRDDGKTCHACLIADCLRCDAAGVCAQCSAGLTLSLSGDACIPCDIGNCTYCSAAGECGVCACGLVPTSDGTECIPCTAANCKHCALSSSNHGGACAVCSDGYDESEGLCQKSGVPSWAVFLIVLAVTLILAALLGLAVLSYRRHRAKVRQMQIDAGVRRDNRQARGRGARHRTEFGIIDVSELEHVASGIRDEHKRQNIKC